jgi:glycosyltransferase involved in cell wall biosynthesis
MNILVTADPELPVPPRLYGGIERVIALLVEGLGARGHAVTLVAHRDSSARVERVAYAEADGGGLARTAANAALIARETRRRRPDVVQSFSRLAYLAAILARRVPKVMSYQRAITPRTVRMANRLAHGTLAFTGCSHQLIATVAHEGSWHVVYNALAPERYTAVDRVADDAPLVFLGRIERIKGVHVAIEVARRSGRALRIAGNVPDSGEARQYFHTEIEPRLDGRSVTYIGAVDDEAKNALLGQGAALLMPVLWDEPFGIVMIEALACGLPVIGFNRGAVPEVVADGITGFVCDDTAAMVEAVGRISTLDRRACRASVEARFSQQALVDAYEGVYRDVVGRA